MGNRTDVTDVFDEIVAAGDTGVKGGYYEAYCSNHGIIGQGNSTSIQLKVETHKKTTGPHAIRIWWWDEP